MWKINKLLKESGIKERVKPSQYTPKTVSNTKSKMRTNTAKDRREFYSARNKLGTLALKKDKPVQFDRVCPKCKGEAVHIGRGVVKCLSTLRTFKESLPKSQRVEGMEKLVEVRKQNVKSKRKTKPAKINLSNQWNLNGDA